VIGVFKETGSGMKLDRAERHKIMALAQARRIDAVLVTELSRWGRSTTDLLATLKELEARRVSVVALNGMTFDLTTPHGRMMATMLAGIADDAVSAVMRTRAARTQELPGLLGIRCYA
jgi:putative DNA-invertase from lambdoid prophage Rac